MTPALWVETVPARWSGSPYLTWNFETLSVTVGAVADWAVGMASTAAATMPSQMSLRMGDLQNDSLALGGYPLRLHGKTLLLADRPSTARTRSSTPRSAGSSSG